MKCRIPNSTLASHCCWDNFIIARLESTNSASLQKDQAASVEGKWTESVLSGTLFQTGQSRFSGSAFSVNNLDTGIYGAYVKPSEEGMVSAM